jgi:hypothetical protein
LEIAHRHSPLAITRLLQDRVRRLLVQKIPQALLLQNFELLQGPSHPSLNEFKISSRVKLIVNILCTPQTSLGSFEHPLGFWKIEQ